MVLCGCQSDQRRNGFEKARSDYKVSKIGRLPTIAGESSGLARYEAHKSLWTHNDSGGRPELYEIDYEGNLLSTLIVPQVQNTDWEDLAQSADGTLYIGDMGNNGNTRQDLKIYSLSPMQKSLPPITFRYADQTAFPPPPSAFNFDCEAFFFYQDTLYLFSKNRGKKDLPVKLYGLPARPGDYTLLVQDSIFINSPVTAADINPAGTTFALLTYGKILLFGIENGKINFDHPKDCIKVGKGQEEALVFVNDTDLMITTEQRGLYLIKHR